MEYLAPFVFVVAIWWISTIVLLHFTGKSPSTFGSTLAWVSVIAGLGLVFIVQSRSMNTATGAYLGFTGALAIWAFLETTYLLGFVTGPRARACPDDVSHVRRFWYGVQTSLYHELTVVLAAGMIGFLTWGTANKAALLTFCVFWLMRWSVKLNIFLGVKNLHTEFWPTHLQYLLSYVGNSPKNLLFPLSLALSVGASLFLLVTAFETGASALQRTTAILVASILLLAILEHMFLMTRVPDALLWRLGMRSRHAAD